MGIVEANSRGKAAMIVVSAFAVVNIAAVLVLVLMATIRLLPMTPPSLKYIMVARLYLLTLKSIQSLADDCECGIKNPATRIVGGEETEPNEYPWQVALLREWHPGYRYQFCGGTIINERSVL